MLYLTNLVFQKNLPHAHSVNHLLSALELSFPRMRTGVWLIRWSAPSNVNNLITHIIPQYQVRESANFSAFWHLEIQKQLLARKCCPGSGPYRPRREYGPGDAAAINNWDYVAREIGAVEFLCNPSPLDDLQSYRERLSDITEFAMNFTLNI